MSANNPYPYTPAPMPPKRRRTSLIITIVGLILILCCCLVVAGVIVFADPFHLHIKDRLFGGTFDAAANAMPEDTGYYVGINLLGATPSDLDRVIQPLADALQINQRSWDDLIHELDKTLGEQMDLTLTDNVKPWIGQYLGIGIFNVQFDNSANPVSLIVAIESRDNGAADDFLLKLRDGIEKNAQKMQESTYRGVTLYVLKPDSGTGVAFCRSGSLVLLSLEEADLRTAIDSQKGKSLADNSQYHDMIGKLPGKRLATVYFTGKEFENLFNELQKQTGSAYGRIEQGLGITGQALQSQITNLNIDQWNSVILSLEVTGAGIQLDGAVAYNLDNLTSAQREALNSMGKASKTIDMFPEDTVAFVYGQRLDLTYDTTIQTLRDLCPDMYSSVNNALQSVRDATNIDLGDNLFHLLDGEFAIGVFPSSQGYLATQGHINLGFAFLAESSDTGALGNTMETLASKLEEQGASVNRSTSGDLSLYQVLQNSGGDVVFAGGIEKNYISLATSGQTIEDLFAGGTPLSKSSRYQDAISALPDGITPYFYLDVEGLLGAIRETLSADVRSSFDQSVRVLQPIPYVVLGYSPLNGNVERVTVVVHVK